MWTQAGETLRGLDPRGEGRSLHFTVFEVDYAPALREGSKQEENMNAPYTLGILLVAAFAPGCSVAGLSANDPITFESFNITDLSAHCYGDDVVQSSSTLSFMREGIRQ